MRFRYMLQKNIFSLQRIHLILNGVNAYQYMYVFVRVRIENLLKSYLEFDVVAASSTVSS